MLKRILPVTFFVVLLGLVLCTLFVHTNTESYEDPWPITQPQDYLWWERMDFSRDVEPAPLDIRLRCIKHHSSNTILFSAGGRCYTRPVKPLKGAATMNITLALATNWSREQEGYPPPLQLSIQPTQEVGEEEDNSRFAYVVVVATEHYVDGALVVAHTLLQHSTKLRNKEVDLLALLSPSLSKVSVQRLQLVGYTVIVFGDISHLTPLSAYSQSFNKLHVFGLLQYTRVVYLDTDILVVKTPAYDTAFNHLSYRVACDKIGAIGSDDKQYFSTRLLVISPCEQTYEHLMKLHWFGNTQSGNSSWNSKNSTTRDGSVLRLYFYEKYTSLPHTWAENTNHNRLVEGLIGFHFPSSTNKPWQRGGSNTQYTLSRRLWWEAYETLHFKYLQEDYNLYPHQHWPTDNRGGISGDAYMWLQRNTTDEYWEQTIQDFTAKQQEPQTIHVRAANKTNKNCVEVCRNEGLECSEEGLGLSWVNSCQTLKKYFGGCAEGCAAGPANASLPALLWWSTNSKPFLTMDPSGRPNYFGWVCVTNYVQNSTVPKPSCSASYANLLRLCTCVKAY